LGIVDADTASELVRKEFRLGGVGVLPRESLFGGLTQRRACEILLLGLIKLRRGFADRNSGAGHLGQ
jgi:hypothetical protein